MKVLVISRSPWDDSNSFGNTFSNLFGGMKGIEIFSICCQDGVNNNGIVSKTYQMTDRSVLNSLIGKHAGSVMASAAVQDCVISKKKSNKFPKKRYTVFYIARDLIWNFGHWWDKDFKSFLDEIKPEVIYLPIYASWYMCDVQQKVVNYCKVPVVGHITDDNYNYPPNGWNQPLAYLYRANVRRKVRKLIAKCSYIEVFAENMAYEYAEIFKKPFYVIGKGIDISKVDQIKVETPNNNPVKYVYTGNIGNGRYLELAKLGKALDAAYHDGGVELLIYTQSMMEAGMQEVFSCCNSLKLCGSVSSKEVLKIQQDADVLVHVESFSKQSIFETKMSFSTKLVDYMMAGKIIFAIGPAEVNSLETLRNYNLAVTACCDDEIKKQVLAIKNGEVDTENLTVSIYKYITTYRDKIVIQKGMFNRLSELIK